MSPLLLGAALAAGPLVVEGADEAGLTRIWVRQADRTGLFVAQPSGDDLYLLWLETTPPPARSPLLPPCEPWARAMRQDPSICAGPPPVGGALRGAVRLRSRRDEVFAELTAYRRDTEQWLWRPIPSRGSRPPSPELRADLPGWTWDPAGWGVGLPLFLPTPVGAPPTMIIGHRGSPGRLPDHTLEGYALAVAQGADAIEPDLVITRDGVLVARHENDLTHTTDVAQRFPDRRRTAQIDGHTVDGFFTEDFTLAELKTLRAVQPWPDRPHDHDGLYTIPTFDEVLELADRLGRERGRPVAVIPETKHPSYFRALGLPLEPPLLDTLRRHNLTHSEHVVIQSFQLDNLVAMASELGARRLLLIDPEEPASAAHLADLDALRAQVEVLGVPRELVWGPAGPTGFLERAQAAGLQVFVWTFRAERPGPAGADPVSEIEAFLRLGVDGVFADQPDLAAAARDRLLR